MNLALVGDSVEKGRRLFRAPRLRIIGLSCDMFIFQVEPFELINKLNFVKLLDNYVKFNKEIFIFQKCPDFSSIMSGILDPELSGVEYCLL